MNERAQAMLDDLYSEGVDRASSAGLSRLVTELWELQQQDRITDIETLLEHADVTRLAPEFVIGLLRINFPVKARLSGWALYLARAEAELCKRNIGDVRIILQGLFP